MNVANDLSVTLCLFFLSFKLNWLLDLLMNFLGCLHPWSIDMSFGFGVVFQVAIGVFVFLGIMIFLVFYLIRPITRWDCCFIKSWTGLIENWQKFICFVGESLQKRKNKKTFINSMKNCQMIWKCMRKLTFK